MGWIKSYWDNKPLALILWVALILRIIAVLFSKGYGMHDDHFLVIETAQSWLDGAAYNNWFLEREHAQDPTILNFFYAGFHYLLFDLLQQLGIHDPQAKMYVVRLIHALWSLLIVFYGYKITERLSDKVTARNTALLLAALWLMPFFSVRNLVEFVCIPLLMAGYWLLLDATSKKQYLLRVFFASLLFGLAFSLRFQTLIIPAGIGLVLLLQKKIKETFVLAAGIILIILLTHGLTDWIIWGKPFTELEVYIQHNIQHRFDYTISPWYTYILVIFGVLIPPVSVMMIAGFIKTWKKYAMLFVPTMLFFVFHSYFPNKQERFILPILPFIIILGMTGWNMIREHYPFWERRKKLVRGSWIFFWVINIFLLALFTTMYSKKARVESMTYLSRYQGINTIVTEDIFHAHTTMLPYFYMGQWPEILKVSNEQSLADMMSYLKNHPDHMPSFVLFFDNKDIEKRVNEMEKIVPGLVFEKDIEPGWLDRVLYWLNPVNQNQKIVIYRNSEKVPEHIKK